MGDAYSDGPPDTFDPTQSLWSKKDIKKRIGYKINALNQDIERAQDAIRYYEEMKTFIDDMK